MITGRQSAAARGLLDWTQMDLADKASVSRQTISDFEAGSRKPIAVSMQSIERVFAKAGVTFIGTPETGVGVRLRRGE